MGADAGGTILDEFAALGEEEKTEPAPAFRRMDTTVTDDNRFYDKNGELIKKVYDD